MKRVKLKGQQHYKNVGMFHRTEPVEEHVQRDQQKEKHCKELGLICIFHILNF